MFRILSPGRRACLIASLSLTVAFAGCSMMGVETMLPWATSKAEKPQPARLAVVWTHATQADAGKPPMRGFRGQVTFFAKEKLAGAAHADAKTPDKSLKADQPLKVDGTLTVFAFDQMPGGKTAPSKPRKFVFDPEQLKKLASDSKPGPVYTVWIPWDKVGGPSQRIRLQIRFDAAEMGPVVMSDPTEHLLPADPDVKRLADAGEAAKKQPR